MREVEIERHLVEKVDTSGGLCVKVQPFGKRGYPDRLVLYPDRPAIWVELKAPGKTPTGQQLLRHGELSRHGFQVVTCDSKDCVERIVNGLR